MKTKKITKQFKVDYSLDWTYGVELTKIKEDIEALERLGVTHIEIEPEDNYGSCSVRMAAFTERIETDKEYKYRIEEQKRRDKEMKEYELQLLERLAKKYKQV